VLLFVVFKHQVVSVTLLENQLKHFFPRLLTNSKRLFAFFQAIFHKPKPTFPESIYGSRNWEDQTHRDHQKYQGNL